MNTGRERSHFVKTSLTVQILGLTRGLELGQNSESSQVSPCLNCFHAVLSKVIEPRRRCNRPTPSWSLSGDVNKGVYRILHPPPQHFYSPLPPLFFSNGKEAKMLPMKRNVKQQTRRAKAEIWCLFAFKKCEASGVT